MKKWLLVMVLFLLTSCYRVSEADTKEKLDEVFRHSGESLKVVRNNESQYFSYYLPSDMYETESGTQYCCLKYQDALIIFNTNIAGIIGSRFYNVSLNDDGFYFKRDLFYHNNGTYTDSSSILWPYSFDVYRMDEDYYLIFNTRCFTVYGKSSLTDLEETARHILLFAKGVEVDTEEILKDFSNKGVIDYQKKQIDLFETIVPSDGVLVEIVVSDDSTIPAQENENDVE